MSKDDFAPIHQAVWDRYIEMGRELARLDQERRELEYGKQAIITGITAADPVDPKPKAEAGE